MTKSLFFYTIKKKKAFQVSNVLSMFLTFRQSKCDKSSYIFCSKKKMCIYFFPIFVEGFFQWSKLLAVLFGWFCKTKFFLSTFNSFSTFRIRLSIGRICVRFSYLIGFTHDDKNYDKWIILCILKNVTLLFACAMKKLTTFKSNGYLCNKRACCIVKYRSTKSSVYSKHHLHIDINQTLKRVVLGLWSSIDQKN